MFRRTYRPFKNPRKTTSKINSQGEILSVAFLVDGNHIVTGGTEQKIRVWRVEDGKETGEPMNARNTVLSIAVSPDGRWIVSGTTKHVVNVWNVQTHEKVGEFPGHSNCQCVDVSPDGTKIACGSNNFTVRVWSLSTGEEVFNPLPHGRRVGAVKFSPDGHLLATATLYHDSVRIYDGRDGRRLLDVPIRINSGANQSLVWTNSKELLCLSHDNKIHSLDASTRITLSRWLIPSHHTTDPKYIALANNGTFIATSDASSVSFWDTATHKQIGPVMEHTAVVKSMAISAHGDIMIVGGTKITLRNLRDILPSPYTEFPRPIMCMDSRSETTVQGLQTIDSPQDDAHPRDEFSSDSTGTLTSGSLASITHLEKAVQELRTQVVEFQRERDDLRHAHEQKHRCEALYAAGRAFEAGLALVGFTNAVSEDMQDNRFLMDWLTEFTSKSTSTLEKIGDDALEIEKYDDAHAAYSIVLSLGPSHNVLAKWVDIVTIRHSVDEALEDAFKFKLPRFTVYKTICDVLATKGHITDAISYFRRMQGELEGDKNLHEEQVQWGFTFQWRCEEQLGQLADEAMDAQNYKQAAEYLSTILSLDGVERMNVLIKRSKARALMKSWEDALSDADQAITLEPSSHLGYERRHAALHGAGRHAEAVEAFDRMLLKINQSPHEDIRKLHDQYHDARPTIRWIVNQTLRHMPSILIDTVTGRLYDRSQQATAFESLPIWNELVSSMTRAPDYARIETAVKKHYRYVMLSHTWEDNEPRLQTVRNTSVYGPRPSPTNIKLQKFCSLVYFLGFRWAWADTTCVDQDNNVVLQESMVAMFTWYRGSSLTLIYLRGVLSESKLPGGLQRSRWNTRAWTYQEYVAAETVQFYTEDWKPYLGLKLYNHKDSPVILAEMQQATGISAQEMAVLRPGLDRIREKLFVASTRQTTRTEDTAYSLLGIFNVSIPVIYGEGDRAVGRLLEHILTGSGDVTILAWTGLAGSYNTCLPVDLTVYHQLTPPHIPLPIEMDEMDSIVTTLRSSTPISLAMKLYNELKALPSPFLASSRLRLGGIICPITNLQVCIPHPYAMTQLRVYRLTTALFGDIEIKTAYDLTGLGELSLMHPWTRPLLDQEYSESRRLGAPDKTTQALRLVARLMQPFGALLLDQVSPVAYKRVAVDSLIMVQLREGAPLTDLLDCVSIAEIQ